MEEGKEIESTDKSEEEMAGANVSEVEEEKAAANVSEVEEEKRSDTAKKSNWSTIVVTLPQLLDLALGTPEVGVINLNILHNFLHVLLQQINIRTTKVEFRGEDARRMETAIASSKYGPDLHLYESKIISGSNQMKQRIHSTDQLTVNVDVIKQDEATAGKSVSAPVSPRNDKQEATNSTNKTMNLDVENNIESRVYVESIVNGLTPTFSAFKQLEENVQRLEKQFEALQELSTNSELIERLKGNLTDPLTDVWNIISINKRLDAAEQGISKLTSMMQEVIKNEKNIKSFTHNMTQTKGKSVEKIISTDVEDEIITDTGDPPPESNTGTEEESANKQDIDINSNELRDKLINICLHKCQDLDTMLDCEVYKLHVELVLLKEDKDRIDKEIQKISKTISSIGSENMQDMLNKIKTFVDNNIEERILKLEHDIMGNLKTLNLSQTYKFPQDIEEKDLNNMISKTQEIQEDIRKLNETANFLMKDTADRNENLNAILEQLQYLQTIKADKEHVDSSLADKADADTLNRKVSHDKFDTACNDLTQEIQQALEQMNLQNSNIVQHFADIQKEIEKKVNKIEVEPLKEYVNKQLNDLGEKIKQMVKTKSEMEAAGTKKMLSGVQCISCNKNTMMRMEESGRFEAPAMPSTRSIKPYLSYELDQIRRHQRTIPYSKDINKLEALMTDAKKKVTDINKSSNEQSISEHGSRRYCGGSHTVTIPEQRLKRIPPTFYSRGNVNEVMETFMKIRSHPLGAQAFKKKYEDEIPCPAASEVPQETPHTSSKIL
ncbi:PREDICTED: uncharacterized protein PFB0765w-like [Polistes canadensis]|uniref:uncharacterized protein PFB0765w-like n=1 Tax=Polistes canadensis TaxID=91411 RepID=UPI000718FC9B|nr:PREDICTED: uncharacterized protein PFB0765w-like [Polistes canadensis]